MLLFNLILTNSLLNCRRIFAGVDLGYGVRKVRMAIKSKGKGRSGGARVITYNIDEKAEVPHIDFLTIYDKSEIDNVSDSYIQSLLKFV